MKGRALIFIFLFLSIVILIFPVSAGTGIGTFDKSGMTQFDYSAGATVGVGTYDLDIIKFHDPQTSYKIRHTTVKILGANWFGSTDNSHWYSVSYWVGGTKIGEGTVGYNKGGSGNYYCIAFFDEDNFDITAYSGNTNVDIVGIPADVMKIAKFGTPVADNNMVAIATDAAGYPSTGISNGEHVATMFYDTTNNYNYTSSTGQLVFYIERDAANKSKITINDGNRDIVSESTYQDQSDYFYSTDVNNNTWTIDWYNDFGDHIRRVITIPVDTLHEADIEFNQTSYTDPENIEVEWDIIGFNSNDYNYEIQIVTSISGDPSQDSWAADGNWNTSPFISSASGAAVFDFYSDGYDLPIWIQAELWAQDKNTGIWTRLDNSPVVIYHEKSDFGVGSIWTEKSTYNLSEMFYIFVETDYPIIDIELISDTYHDRQTLEVFEGGWQRLGYAFFSPHNFTAYLYEDGIVTNQTSFSVWTTSPMLNIFLDSAALKSQFAFEFYTDNSSDTITGYKPDGSIFYGPITDLETNGREIIRGVSSSSPPGIYTISLFHDGTTYYNDTIELYSTSEWVYFDASKYETGDRIKIYSFVTDSRQQVRLTDSIGTAVITWTDSAGYIIPNSQTVLYFSLTDNNEYGMNVNTSIDSGTFRTGNWKVEIIGIDGKSLTDASTYDYTTVSKKIESPADTSNEMISIFFSLEGAFLLFTVCLTMMGLVLAKHPAGGGAGAVVGVGFGVYFNVLPVWMLMLAVITLVVLAGVSIAVYFKGK